MAPSSTLLARLGFALGLRALPALIGQLLLLFFFWKLATDPGSLPDGSQDAGTAIWLFEFLFLHSFAFLAVARGGVKAAWVPLPVYALFAIVIGSNMGTPILMVLFLWHLAASLFAAWIPKAEEPSVAELEKWQAFTLSQQEATIRMWAGYGYALVAFMFTAAGVGVVSTITGRGEETGPVWMGVIYFALRAIGSVWVMTIGRRIDAVEVMKRVK